jgi:hypothetical protein
VCDAPVLPRVFEACRGAVLAQQKGAVPHEGRMALAGRSAGERAAEASAEGARGARRVRGPEPSALFLPLREQRLPSPGPEIHAHARAQKRSVRKLSPCLLCFRGFSRQSVLGTSVGGSIAASSQQAPKVKAQRCAIARGAVQRFPSVALASLSADFSLREQPPDDAHLPRACPVPSDSADCGCRVQLLEGMAARSGGWRA